MDKLTLRDIFVYFLTGIIGTLMPAILFADDLISILKSFVSQTSEIMTIVYIALVAVLYFNGHLSQAMEDAFHVLCRKFHNNLSKTRFLSPIDYLLNGHRIIYALRKYNLVDSEFWKLCTQLQLAKEFHNIEYWQIMSDFFQVISFVSLLVFIGALLKFKFTLMVLYFIVGFLCWSRSRIFARVFVREVVAAYSLSKVLER